MFFFDSAKRAEKKRRREAQKRLERAILSDDTAGIAQALEDGADPNHPNDADVLPLTIVLARDNLVGARILVRGGASLSSRGSHGTPLHALCQLEDQEAALDVMEAADDEAELELDARNAMGQTPLHMACLANNDEIARVLVELGADVNAEDDLRSTPALAAASNGDFELVRFLCDKGADLEVRSSAGEDMLAAAIVAPEPSPDLVGWLLMRGADGEAVNDDGETPLHLACRKRAEEDGREEDREMIIFALLAAGADPDPGADRHRLRPIDYVKDDAFVVGQLLGNAKRIREDPGAALSEVGVTAFLAKRLPTAERFLVEAVRSDDEDAAAHYHLGVLRLERGQQDEAMDLLVRAAQLGDEEALGFMQQMGIELG